MYYYVYVMRVYMWSYLLLRAAFYVEHFKGGCSCYVISGKTSLKCWFVFRHCLVEDQCLSSLCNVDKSKIIKLFSVGD